jgi:hypothetical protein
VTAPTRPRRAAPDPPHLAGPPPARETSPRPPAPEAAGLVSTPQCCRAADVGRCTCGHLSVFHDLPKRKAGYVRTGCSWTEGAKAEPCGCPLYQEATA